jgi:hypothetical protein
MGSVARFLSSEWFDDLAAGRGPLPPDADGASLVLEQVVEGTPDGDVRYLVIVRAGQARVERAPGGGAAADVDLTITADWITASAIAQGTLSAQRALMEGRLRVRGSTSRLSGHEGDLVGLDPVPPEVRHRTTF